MFQRFSVAIILYLSMVTSSFALPEDNQATLHIVSDSAYYNYKTGTKIFIGHVKVDQGTTHITADKLITKSNADNKIQKAIAYGFAHLAHYTTLPKEGDHTITAEAKTITFYPLTLNAVLEKNATVTQNGDVFQGELIYYDSNKQTVTIPAVKHGRALLIYHPDKDKS